MIPVLKLKKVSKYYGSKKVVDSINFSLFPGQVFGFIGPNGAGKSTTIKMICGLTSISGGSIFVDGYNVSRCFKKAIQNVGAVVESPLLYPYLSGYKNLKLYAKFYGKKAEKRINNIMCLTGMNSFANKKVSTYSLGMKQRLGIAIALCGNPEFLILDEPNNGLDPEGIVDMRNLLIRLNKERQITILISSHILDELSKIATHYGFVKDGKIIKEISAEELEKECHISLKIVVDNKKIENVLKCEKYNYKMINETTAEIYGDIEITPLILKLHEENINVLKISDNEEKLEKYFFNILGGEMND